MKTKITTNLLNNNKGQTFMEFIFLFVTLVILSFVMLKSTNTGVAERWVTLISIITSPDPETPIKPTLN